ncbi:MAG TPA: hypothetical protein VIG06_13195 [Kofleriaceae bacterium]
MGLREVAPLTALAALAALAGCAKFGSGNGDDGRPLGDAAAGPLGDGGAGADAGPLLGTEGMPAADCAELRDAGFPSGTGWVRHPDGVSPAFEVYCEQELNGGGWAMLYNSVLREDGTTTAFWQFDYAARLGTMGTAAPDENYYQGALYLIGTSYFDAFTDLGGASAVALEVSADGFDQGSMAFIAPTLVSGDANVFNAHYAAGWSARDRDGDIYPDGNCATLYSDIAQHYSACWNYNLGSDADDPHLDGGVGPHVANAILTALALTPQADGGAYSRVQRIARFTRW